MVEVFGSKDGNRKAGFFCGSSGEICSKGAWSYHMHGHGNDVIVLGTSKGWIIRHDFRVGDSYAGEQSIHKVFVDPGGSADTFYTHAKWTRPRVLSKLKASTREVILGTDNGQLHEIAVDEKDKKEKHINFLFELKELPEAFMGLQMETASTSNGTKYYMMAVTPMWLYSFSGIGSLDTVFVSYVDRPVRFMELPGEIPNSELHFFIKQRRAVHFAWLSRAGIYHGGLNFGAQHSSPEGNENFVENKGLLDYSKLVDVAEAIKPNSLAVSEFHFLLLLGNKVKVRLSVQRTHRHIFNYTYVILNFLVNFVNELHYLLVIKGIIGLCKDASIGLFYAYDRVSVNDEGRDMWKVYRLEEVCAALANCRDPFRRDQVYLACIYYILSFEEITLKFISVNEQDVLRTFLLRKLDNLAKDDKCQITMISTWATELYLDKINRLLLEDDTALENRSSEYHSVIKEFRAFLSDCKDVLDEATTMNLLESYGRVDELVYFASLKEQYEIVVHHYIQQGEAKKALKCFKNSVPIDLRKDKFAPDLIMLDAYETVEKLIPAMMRYSSEPHAKNETHEVIKYLEFCVHRLQNEDPGVHNLLLSLYEDDSALLRFLQCKFGKGRLSGPEFFYDPKYALRLCLKEKRMRACIHIYSMMSMHEEAVALALQVDPELAKAETDKVEDDEDLRKKLWLMVAKHVVEQEKGTKRENIRKAIAFLKETDGLLKIEDILPFFPDFALIDDFKVCQRKILTAGWDHRMARGYTSVGAMAPFYVFPCGHAFHAQCLIAHVTRCTHRDQAEYILDLQKQLTLLGGESKESNGTSTEEESITSMTPTDKIRSQLDDVIACECPFCGDLMIREISLPLILPGEAYEAASWKIRPHNIGAQKSLSLAV
ncbi:Vacuolar sorting protein 18 [Camellia lanceoleosa]|uniref:Vacuolar sorting protein 18 n=1 Tax=Camellia lanceoleosa TaxID=1840588 RepID=A0ACC0GUW1_9ERIC|nr:Vacuolar sorting protein 18 [Camellia lanceoleosa]